MQRIKVVHLTSVHRPVDNRIFHKECKTLAEAGYEVVLVAPHDRDEVVDGIRIRAVAKPDSRSERMLRTVPRVLKVALNENADFYHFHDVELLPIGMLLKLCGKYVVYDVHDDISADILIKNYIPRPLRLPMSWSVRIAERIGSTFFDAVVTASPVVAMRFPTRKTVSVQNFPSPDELMVSNQHSYPERAHLVAYVGDITSARGIEEMVRAISMLPETLECKLLLAGSFTPPELELKVGKMPGWSRVDFLGWQSREGVARLLARSRLGLVVLHPTPAFVEETYPWKLFEYMSAGIPIVASDFPIWRRIIEGAGCGILVDPLDPEVIAEAIQWLLSHPAEAEAMGFRGRQAVVSRYNWDNEGRKLVTLYERLSPLTGT